MNIKGLLCSLLLLSSTAQAETLLEIGPTQISDNLHTGWMITISERFKDRYEITLGEATTQTFTMCDRPDCRWEVRPQLFFGAELLLNFPKTNDKFKFSIGPYIFQNSDRIGTDTFRVGMSLEYRFNDRFGIRARHFSLGGSGKDITICRDKATWEVAEKISEPSQQYACLTNDWNTGLDSWLRAVIYF